MGEQLWLDEARSVIVEPQAGWFLPFDTASGDGLQALLDEGYLVATAGKFFHCTTGGALMPMPDMNLLDMTASEWVTTCTSGSWSTDATSPRTWPRDDRQEASRCLSYRGQGSWTMTSAASQPYGMPIFLRWVTSKQQGQSQQPLTLEFGGCWRIRLMPSGQGDLSRKSDIAVLGDTSGVYQQVATYRWMTEREYAPSIHWLWVYQIGPRLVVRSFQGGTTVRENGTVYLDPTPHHEPVGANGPLLPWVTQHALHPGSWVLSGTGPITVSLVEQRWQAVEATLGLAEPDQVGIEGEGKTTVAQVRLSGVVQCHATDEDPLDVEVLTVDGQGAPWPQAPDGEPLDEAQPAFKWTLRWVPRATVAPIITSLNVRLPARHGSDGLTPVDLYALPRVAVRQVQVVRDPDLSREAASLLLRTACSPLVPYLRGNALVRYVVDGVTRFRGYTTGGDWTVLKDVQGGQVGDLTIPCAGLWQRFVRARWPGGEPADGRLLRDVLVEVLEAAGLASQDYEVPSAAVMQDRLPEPPEGEAPAIVWRPGSSVDQILADLRDKWFGTGWMMWNRPTDGKFVVQPVDRSLATHAAFYETTALAHAAGSQAVILEGTFKQNLDTTEQANAVTVIGQTGTGKVLLARAVDWPSIRGNGNGTVPWNYVGDVWHNIVVDPALATQEAVEWVCGQLYTKWRYPRVMATWESIRVDVHPGHVVELVGPNYASTRYLLRGATLLRTPADRGAHPAGHGSYAAELIREGVTL